MKGKDNNEKHTTGSHKLSLCTILAYNNKFSVMVVVMEGKADISALYSSHLHSYQSSDSGGLQLKR